jgi:hypothetical protein
MRQILQVVEVAYFKIPFHHFPVRTEETMSGTRHLHNSKQVVIRKTPFNTEEFYLLGYNGVKFVDSQATFRRNMSPPSAG